MTHEEKDENVLLKEHITNYRMAVGALLAIIIAMWFALDQKTDPYKLGYANGYIKAKDSCTAESKETLGLLSRSIDTILERAETCCEIEVDAVPMRSITIDTMRVRRDGDYEHVPLLP